MKRTKIIATVAATLISASAAWADTTTTTPADAEATATTSTSIQPSTFKKILSKTTMTFITNFNGPAIGTFSSPLIPNDYGVRISDGLPTNGPIYFDSALVTTYGLNDKGLVAGLGVPFVYFPSGNYPSPGQDLMLNDPYVKVGHNKLFNNGRGFNVAADLRVYLPVTKTTHNNNGITNLRTVPNVTWDVPGTKWTLGSMFSFRYYFYGSQDGARNAGNNDIDAWAYPNVNYQIAPTVGLNMGYYMETTRPYNRGDNGPLAFNNAGTDLNFGASWDINSRINVSPWVVVNPGGKISWDSTLIGSWITAKIL